MDKTTSFAVLIFVAACSVGPTLAAADETDQGQQSRWEASSEKKYTVKLEATPPVLYCESRTSIEYYQDDQNVQVDGEIKVDGCTDASGTYTISVRFRDETGATHNLDFDESWQRISAAPIVISNAYPMAENVDLIRVRARRSRCVCNDTETTNAEQEVSPPTEPRKD